MSFSCATAPRREILLMVGQYKQWTKAGPCDRVRPCSPIMVSASVQE